MGLRRGADAAGESSHSLRSGGECASDDGGGECEGVEREDGRGEIENGSASSSIFSMKRDIRDVVDGEGNVSPAVRNGA